MLVYIRVNSCNVRLLMHEIQVKAACVTITAKHASVEECSSSLQTGNITCNNQQKKTLAVNNFDEVKA
ncbi:hypothetical protein QVD17_09158 [Tagetes erecta]|uniref:Uncharacterized protein n=1 Tax=Tagetes erecta TaxID=13708 RepID=A0AAD8L3C6_TARER|nr:hypothetical protein QVD17_09158 [Tagetes erecta]